METIEIKGEEYIIHERSHLTFPHKTYVENILLYKVNGKKPRSVYFTLKRKDGTYSRLQFFGKLLGDLV